MSVLFFLKEFNYIWGKTLSKKSCTVLYVKAIYIMAIDFFRHAIQVEIAFRLKCPENYAMHTERINSAVHSSVILSFCKDLNFILWIINLRYMTYLTLHSCISTLSSECTTWCQSILKKPVKLPSMVRILTSGTAGRGSSHSFLHTCTK